MPNTGLIMNALWIFFWNFSMVILWKTEQCNGELIHGSPIPTPLLWNGRYSHWICSDSRDESAFWWLDIPSLGKLDPSIYCILKDLKPIKGSFLFSILILLSLLLVLWISNFNYIFCTLFRLRNDGLCAHFLLLSLVMDIFILLRSPCYS